MSEKNDTPFPSPEEFQKEIIKMFKDGAVKPLIPEQDYGKVKGGPPQDEAASYAPAFDLKPKEVKEHLDRFVIQQDEAKKTLAIAVCDHYNHVTECLKASGARLSYSKQNVIMIGPPGVGKTYLIRCIAELIGVPFVKADATKFSETGYVGGDVEDLVRELVQRADGNINFAQYGIVYLDEVDKIAGEVTSAGRDVSGYGVQRGLLKLMEETDVPLQSPTDIAGQMQSMMEFQKEGRIKKKTINTRHILFIVSGAFDGMKDIIKKRITSRHIGFGQVISPLEDSDYFHQAQTKDFIEFGLEPEFIGRLPVRVACDPLSEEDLYDILRSSEESIIKQYEASFKAYGIEAVFAADALREIAARAVCEQTGARGLLTIIERIVRDFKYELPSSEHRRFVITPEVVRHPRKELKKMLHDTAYTERAFIIEEVRRFGRKFAEKLALTIVFDETALDYMYEKITAATGSASEICEHLLSDYEYGLDLVRRNTGRTEFVLDRGALEHPKATLDAWIKDVSFSE